MTRDYALGVCGFPRCGSSMTMRMLDAGGLQPVDGSSRPGSYELHGLDGFADRKPADLIGRAVKLLDYVQWYGVEGLRSVPWRFVWLHRDGTQQARSFIKFTSFLGMPSTPDAEARLRRSYRRDAKSNLLALRSVGRVLELDFETILAAPVRSAYDLEHFCGIDPVAATAVVHERSPECRPDLSVELSMLREVS